VRSLLVAALAAGALLASAQPAAAAPPSWYPPLQWLPASSRNYDVGRGGARITHIVIHSTAGGYVGALSWFLDPRSDASAHYVIRARDGEITQMVAEANTAFHARGFNRGSIGIEHEFDPAHGVGYTDQQYRSSAALACAIARRYGIPTDRAHIIGHSEVANTDHTDPGPSWDWSYYMRLVSGCAAPNAVAASGASSGTTCDASACRPSAGLAFGASGASVALLQWDLVYLGWMPQAAVIEGGGHFGPQTLAALRAFQGANGVPATGFYGPLTEAALARSLAGAPSAARQGLTIGSQSADVARLQSDLRRLGYATSVTGYFGPVTEAALRQFQREHGIDATGTYGPLTHAAMRLHTR